MVNNDYVSASFSSFDTVRPFLKLSDRQRIVHPSRIPTIFISRCDLFKMHFLNDSL